MLKTQTPAPFFQATDQHGAEHTLNMYAGKYVVLYFYPRDDTPGCTIEACTLRDNYSELNKRAAIIGVSDDDEASHKAFAEKYHLPFTLLADTDKSIITAYEAKGIFTKRITYIIDPNGIIAKTYPNVNPSQHADEIIRDLDSLRNTH